VGLSGQKPFDLFYEELSIIMDKKKRDTHQHSEHLDQIISRKKFLQIVGVVAAVAGGLTPFIGCRYKENDQVIEPELLGLSNEHYRNINSVAEVFLAGSPVKKFDTGEALDQYLYQRPTAPAIEKKVLELLALPSSVFIALLFDQSFTPLAALPVKEREKRLRGWKESSIGLKKMAYHAFRQLSLMLLSSSVEYQRFCGYDEKKYFQPYIKGIR